MLHPTPSVAVGERGMSYVNPLHEAAAGLGLHHFAAAATWACDLTAAGVLCEAGDITQLSRQRPVRTGLALQTNHFGIYSNTFRGKSFFQIQPDAARAAGGRDDSYWPPNARPAVEARAVPAQLRARANAFIKAEKERRRVETDRRASRPDRSRSRSPPRSAALAPAPGAAAAGLGGRGRIDVRIVLVAVVVRRPESVACPPVVHIAV